MKIIIHVVFFWRYRRADGATKNTGGFYRNEKSGKLKLVLIKTHQLADEDFNYKKYLSTPENVIWITGLDHFMYDCQSHELFLNRMHEINRKTECKVVVEIPFDLDFIDEAYDRYNLMSKDNFEKMNQLAILKKKWKIIFADYAEFNGYIADPNDSGDNTLALNSASFESDTRFLSIWNNLTNYEKIVLFDLADDGLLNIKNSSMINQLFHKKLIELKPYPELFSVAFKDFIKRNMTSDSIKEMENELGIKGKWKNTQYLILLILIPLAAFILISQGLSIEKIFGIFAGVLTIVTGAMKLFDSHIFKTSE